MKAHIVVDNKRYIVEPKLPELLTIEQQKRKYKRQLMLYNLLAMQFSTFDSLYGTKTVQFPPATKLNLKEQK